MGKYLWRVTNKTLEVGEINRVIWWGVSKPLFGSNFFVEDTHAAAENSRWRMFEIAKNSNISNFICRAMPEVHPLHFSILWYAGAGTP